MSNNRVCLYCEREHLLTTCPYNEDPPAPCNYFMSDACTHPRCAFSHSETTRETYGRHHTPALRDTIPGSDHHIDFYCNFCETLILRASDIRRIYTPPRQRVATGVWAKNAENVERLTEPRRNLHKRSDEFYWIRCATCHAKLGHEYPEFSGWGQVPAFKIFYRNTFSKRKRNNTAKNNRNRNNSNCTSNDGGNDKITVFNLYPRPAAASTSLGNAIKRHRLLPRDNPTPVTNKTERALLSRMGGDPTDAAELRRVTQALSDPISRNLLADSEGGRVEAERARERAEDRARELEARVSAMSLVMERDCVVCMDAEPDHALVPCGHRLCGDCTRLFMEERRRCPTCRGEIEGQIRVFD